MYQTVMCSGVISFGLDNAPTCSVAWTLVPATEPFDPSQLDPLVIAQMFGAGFSLVGSVLLVSICIGALLRLIRRG